MGQCCSGSFHGEELVGQCLSTCPDCTSDRNESNSSASNDNGNESKEETNLTPSEGGKPVSGSPHNNDKDKNKDKEEINLNKDKGKDKNEDKEDVKEEPLSGGGKPPSGPSPAAQVLDLLSSKSETID